MRLFHSLIFLTFSYVIGIEASAGCTMNLIDGLPKLNSPLYLEKGAKGKMDWIFPILDDNRKPIVEFSKGENIIVACPGPNNKLKATNLQINTATCHVNNEWTINGKQFDLGELKCDQKIVADAKIYPSNCAGGKGTQLGLGYTVEHQRLDLVRSCHNIYERETYFSRHTLHGSSIANTGRSESEFIKGNTKLYGFNPNTAYLTRNQKEILPSVFGKDDVDMYDRGHLTPDADFTFAVHKAVTYMYPNVAPQNSKNNQGIWVAIESTVRLLAQKLHSDVIVTTGTYEYLHGVGSEAAKLYPKRNIDNSIPIPEYYWKLLMTSDFSCIVLISKNVREADTSFCNDLCNQLGWGDQIQRKFNYFRRLRKLRSESINGHVNCCHYKDVEKSINYLPSKKCKKDLVFPNDRNSNRRRGGLTSNEPIYYM